MTRPADEPTLPPSNVADPDATLPPPGDPDATLAPSPTVGAPPDPRAPAGYVIERELGRGGMGVVYLARDVKLDRLCALKMILSGAHAGFDDAARFRTEAQAIARLQHPGIVQVFEVGEHDGHPFMALEYCPGGSLDAVLAKNPLRSGKAAELLRALAEAVHVAHRANVLHRDLKPANVLLAADGTPKVTDFGLAKKLDEDGATRTGAVMGTPSYMPPEQAEGKKDVGPAADIYALGAILYECLTGRPPFRAATPLDTLLQVLSDEPVPVRRLNPGVPPDLETICHKCLRKDPGKRYHTAQELADDLARYSAGLPVKARPIGPVERGLRWVKRNPVVSGLLAAVLVVLTAGVTVSWRFAWQAGQNAQAEADARVEALREKASAERQLRRAERSVYSGRLLLAQVEFAAGNLPEAFRHLNGSQWDLRGWEHRHLRWRFDGSSQTLIGHQRQVTGVAWSPDGKRLLTGGDDTARVWDAETGKELLSLAAHNLGVACVAFRPDGKRFVTGSTDHTAKVWDAETGTGHQILKGHKLPVTCVAWSPDGRFILTGSQDRTAAVWDAETGIQLHVLRGHNFDIHGVAWSPDGKRVLTGSGDKSARIWDVAKGAVLRTLQGHTADVTCAAWGPDGGCVVTGSRDKSAKVWDAEKGTELLALNGHTDWVASVCFSPDGARILTGGGYYFGTQTHEPGEAKLWDARDGTELRSLIGHAEGVTGVCFSPDGRRILTGSSDTTAKSWDAASAPRPVTFTGSIAADVANSAWSPDGKRILTRGDNAAKVWDAENGTELHALAGHTADVTSAAWSPDGRRILTGSKDKTAAFWDADKGTRLHVLPDHGQEVWRVAWSPDGARIIVGGSNTAKVWDADRGTKLVSLAGDHASLLISGVWSPDGKRILSGNRIWDAEKGTELLSLKASRPGRGVAWSPDGQRVLTVSGQGMGKPGEVKVWDADTGAQLLALKGHAGPVLSVCISPDGRRILTGSQDRTAKVWDAGDGIELLTLGGHRQAVNGVAWSPDGRRILTGSEDGTVRAWETASVVPFYYLEGHNQRVTKVAWSPEGKRLLSASDDHAVKVWEVEQGTELSTLDKYFDGPTLAWSPDGRRILTGNRDKTASIWDAATGTALHTFEHNGNVIGATFSSDGTTAFVWDTLRQAKAWDVVTGRPVAADGAPAPPERGPFKPESMTSPDGRLVAQPYGDRVLLFDPRQITGRPWPWPDLTQRKRYHRERAASAEAEKRWFAVAFHLGRLLLDDPDNADLKRRRDDALNKHQGM